MKNEVLRLQIWDILQHGRGRVGRVFTLSLVSLIILSVAVLPLEFISVLEGFSPALLTLEVMLTALFTAEYALRIYSAPNRMQYIFSFFGIIDLVSIAPFYIGLFGTQYVRALRLTRLVRLLKVSRIQAAAVSAAQENQTNEVELFEREQIEHIVSHHPIFFLIGLVPPLLITSAGLLTVVLFSSAITISIGTTFLIFAGIFLWKAWLDYRYDVIYVTNQRLIFQNWHLLGRNTNQVTFRAIMNVKPRHTGIISYILGYGSIVIETAAAESGSIEHKLLRSHEKSAKIIMQKSLTARSSDVVGTVTDPYIARSSSPQSAHVAPSSATQPPASQEAPPTPQLDHQQQPAVPQQQ